MDKETPRKKASGIRKTPGWRGAEWEYESLHVTSMIPVFGTRLSDGEKLEQLESIAGRCPEFYPAVLDAGLQRLAKGEGRHAEQRIEEGFGSLLALSTHLDEEIDALIDNLEDLWRYDLCAKLLQPLCRRRPRKAKFKDRLAAAFAQMGDCAAATRLMDEALKLRPKNPVFISNKGWVLLMAGEVEAAGPVLRRALQLRPADEVTKGNLEVQRYLAAHGGDFVAYLLRPVDRQAIEKLADEEEWEEVDRLCDQINHCRREALALSLLREGNQLRRLPDLLSTLRIFFDFVRRVTQDGVVLDEDLSRVATHFSPLMNKFIFKFGDVDREVIDSVYEALLAYFGFLADKDLVAAGQFEGFRTKILGMKDKIITKMERYNAIRHDPGMNEEEKEAIREKLFRGDHSWPFL